MRQRKHGEVSEKSTPMSHRLEQGSLYCQQRQELEVVEVHKTKSGTTAANRPKGPVVRGN